MNTWDDLREIRAAGLKPSLPVVVTVDGKRPAWLLSQEGCLVVKHNPGESFPVELLDGLRVMLFLNTCDRASALVRAMNSKGVKPAELAAWCPCQQRLDYQPVRCEVAAEWQ